MRIVRLPCAIVLVATTAACSDPGASSTDQALEPTQEASDAQASPGASASTDPLAVCADVPVEGEPFSIAIETVSFAFDTEVIEGPRACQPFTITFTNNDVNDPQDGGTGDHDIDIRADSVLGPLLFDGEAIGGPGGTITYEVPGLPAGEHYFYCSFHTGVMNGTLIVTDS
jgi:azurin